MSMWIERLNAQRNTVSSSVSLAMVALIWLLSQTLISTPRHPLQEAMELSFVEAERAPMAPALSKPVVQPKLNAAPLEKTKPLTAPTPELKPLATATPTSSISSPSPTNAEPIKAESPKPQPAVVAAPAAPQPIAEPVKPAPAPSSASIESSYVATVRAQLNANKRYPTGREASLQRPSGKTVVWFVLSRNGSLNDAGIEDSSNSIILDNAALSTVRRTTYATWPEGSWPGQSQHRFTVTLDFAPVN
jgi:protein TonB